MKRKISAQALLNTAADQYSTRLNEIGEQVRRELIIPFCDRTGYQFSAGMGSWSFHKDGKMLSDWDDSNVGNGVKGLPKKIYDALHAETLFNNDLGSLIEDYKPVQQMTHYNK
jgi:hypothetical protein